MKTKNEKNTLNIPVEENKAVFDMLAVKFTCGDE
jgi:hypothetical protein